MSLVFSHFFRRTTPHYTVFLFSGTIVMSYFSESTKGGMSALLSNSGIISKINVPKYLFVFSKNVSSLIGFLLTVIVFFIFVVADDLTFSWRYIYLIIPLVFLTCFCVGIGMILSIMFVLFRDTEYLYDVFLTLLRYMSAVFYDVDTFPHTVQRLFLCNPIYVYIKYLRLIVIDGLVPSLPFNLLCCFYGLAALLLGFYLYKKLNHKIIYYI